MAVLPALRASTSLAALPACVVTSLVALRPASADFFRISATWLARDSRDFGVDLLELGGHLVAHQLEDLLAGLAAPLDQVVHPLLCLAALDVSGVHQLSHDLLGPATADLSEDGPRIEVLAYALIACHCNKSI